MANVVMRLGIKQTGSRFQILGSPKGNKNAKKQNGCLGKPLQIAVKRREVRSMQRNRGKQENGKDWRSLQEN